MIFNVGAGGGASTADKVKYDNTESGLQSDNVQGAVDELNSSLTYVGLSNQNGDTPIIKKGGIVFINTIFHGSFTANSIVTTLPEGFRPSQSYNYYGIGRSGCNSFDIFLVTINTDGTIVLQYTSATWDWIPINCCFPV